MLQMLHQAVKVEDVQAGQPDDFGGAGRLEGLLAQAAPVNKRFVRQPLQIWPDIASTVPSPINSLASLSTQARLAHILPMLEAKEARQLAALAESHPADKSIMQLYNR